MQVSGDGEPLMAQAGDTLLSRKSQGALKVDISAASAASTSDAQPAADFGPTSPQGTSQLVRYYPFSKLSIICLPVRKALQCSTAGAHTGAGGQRIHFRLCSACFADNQGLYAD